MRRGLGTGSLKAGLLAASVLLCAHRASATVALAPNAQSLFPTQSVTVTVTLSGLNILVSGTGTLAITGLPAGVTAVPAAPTYVKVLRLGTASTTFTLNIGANATAGPYTFTVTDQTFAGGSATFALTISEPQMRLSITTPTITLGASAVNVPVRVSVDPGFGLNAAGGVPVVFGVDTGGAPAGVTAGGSKTELSPFTNTLNYLFSRTGAPPGGSYAVPLTATWTGTTGKVLTSTSTLTLNIPDIAVVLPTSPVVCNGGLAVRSLYTFNSVFGYAGNALINPISLPAGITETSPKSITLAIGQSLGGQAFSVQAAGAPLGAQSVTYRLQDAAAAVNKTFPVAFTVVNPDVAASTTSASISLQAGGVSQAFTANTLPPPLNCNVSPRVDYTITGLPAGFTLPGTVSVNYLISYPPASLPISAAAGVVPGSYPANVHFNVPSTGQSGNVPVTVNVFAGPDFTLSAAPNPITIRQGQTGNVVITLNPLGGFTATAGGSVPAIQSITPSCVPSTNCPAGGSAFSIFGGGPVTMAFTVAANAAPGTYTAPVNASAAGVPGTRTVSVSIVVPPPPDFTLTANPPTLTLSPGATGKITFTMTALNGWNTPTTLSIPAIPNVTAAPATGPFPGTGGSIDVFFTAAAGAPNGTLPFTATASTPPVNIVTTRSAAANIVIQPPPDFSLTVAPLAVRVLQGDTGTVAVTANPLYGFAGAVAVSMPAVGGVSFVPQTFPLAAGASANVQVVTTPSTPTGTRTVVLSGTAPGVTGPRTGSFSLTVDPKADFNLIVQPPTATLAPLGTTQVTVTVQALNNFAAPVDVTAPTTLQGISFSPLTASIPVGTSRTFDVSASAVASGTSAGSFTGTAAGVTGSRAATYSVSITSAPDFQVQLTPPSLVLPAGSSGSSTVSILPINGFGGTFNVAVAPPAGITVAPLSIPNVAGNTPAPLNVAVATGVSGVFDVPVTATSTQTGLVHSATLRVSIPAQDYALTAVPASLVLAPGGSAPVTITSSPINGFSGVVTVVPALPPGVDVDQKSFSLAPGESKTVTVSLLPGAASFVSLPFNGTTPGGPSHSASVAISAQTTPDFTLTVTPSVINLPAGGRAAAQVTLVPLNGWSGGVDVAATGSSGISIVPGAFPLQPGVPYPVEIRAADDAPAGAVTLFFNASGANGGAGVTVTRTVNVQVTVAAADFNVRVTPPAPSVVAGRTADLSLVLEPIGGFGGSVVITPVSMPPGVTLTPPQPALTPNVPQAATLSIPRVLSPGAYTLVFRADEVPSPNVRRRPLLISKTLNVPLTVLAASGGFTVTVSPTTALVSPDQPVAVRYELRSLSDAPLTITGDTYLLRDRSGAVLGSVVEPLSIVLPPRGAVTVSNTVLVTGEQFGKAGSPPVVLADRTFRAVPDATGYIPNATATVTATAANSLLSTASATRISIVYPPSGTLVGRGNSLRAQGLVVGSGTGNLLVGWFFDGILVETATVPLQNGTPTSVSNAITLPTLISGNHEIALSVLAPNTLSSPPVQIYVEEGQQTLRLVSPTAGAVLSPAFGAPTFAWIPAPGIARYGVGLRRRAPGAPWRWSYTTDTRWSPPASLWTSLSEGEYEWGVRGFTNAGRAFLDSQSGGASAPPTSEGSLDMAEGWTVSSAQGRFSIGGSEAALQDLHGQATADPAGVRFVWQEIAGALYVHTLYEQAPEGLKRVRTEILSKPFLLIPSPAIPRGGPFLWRVSAVDKDGRPLGAMAAARVPAAGGAR
ncbi:MAG TPA: hypothetical protein VGM13_17185 [Thermoanaerobaculia bacterium]|jgi:hypothetical protein